MTAFPQKYHKCLHSSALFTNHILAPGMRIKRFKAQVFVAIAT